MIRLLVAAAIVMPCLGCASVTRGTTENISIATTPAGATAEISGLEIPTACVTPCVVQAKRNADITVAISKEGYEPQVIPLTKEVPGSGAAGFAGNILAGGLIGMGVDAATGARRITSRTRLSSPCDRSRQYHHPRGSRDRQNRFRPSRRARQDRVVEVPQS